MPYLDAKMFFNEQNELAFGVYFKPGYKNKYVDRGSMHTPACLDAIPKGVAIRLGSLTTRTSKNENKSLSILYPIAHQALLDAGLLKIEERLPKLGELLDEREKEQISTAMKAKARKKDKRNVYISDSWSGNWKEPLHILAKKLAKKNGLGWFRARMAHKRFGNLKEMLLADCAKKVMERIIIIPHRYKVLPKKICGCQEKTKIDGKCAFGGLCRAENVIYKARWKPTNKHYLGKTQDDLKGRIFDHYHKLKLLWNAKKLAEKYRTDPSNSDNQNQNPNKKTPHIKTPKATPTQGIKKKSDNDGISHLINLISDKYKEPLQPQISNDENELQNEKISQTTQLTPKTRFQAEFGVGMTATELRTQENRPKNLPKSNKDREDEAKTSCTALTRYIWDKVEKQKFETTGEMYIWVRNNLEVTIVHQGSVSSRMKTAGSKNCSLCMAERMTIYYDSNHKERSKYLMNKKSELYGRCSCTTRFHRLTTEREGGC